MYFIKFVTRVCCRWEVTKSETISDLGLHGSTISTTHSDTIGGALVVCTMIDGGDKMIGYPTIQRNKLGSRVLDLVLVDQISGVPLDEGIADFIWYSSGWWSTIRRSD